MNINKIKLNGITYDIGGSGSIDISDIPVASSTALGIVKVGKGLNIDDSGTLYIDDSTIADVEYKAGTGLKLSNNTFDHTNSVSSKNTGFQQSKKLNWGDSFNIYEELYDAQGHVTGINTSTITMPDAPNYNNSYTLPVATHDTLGGVKIGSNLTIGNDGMLAAMNTTYEVATQSSNGLMSAIDKQKLDNLSNGGNNYILPIASSTVLGGVKIGSNLYVSSDGTISAKDADLSNYYTKQEVNNSVQTVTTAYKSDLTNYLKKEELASNVAGTSTNTAPTQNAVKVAIEDIKQTVNQQNETLNNSISQQNSKIESEFAKQTALINGKQLEIGAMEFDTTPTKNSGHGITSGGVYDALKNSMNTFDFSIAYSDSNTVEKKDVYPTILVNGSSAILNFKYAPVFFVNNKRVTVSEENYKSVQLINNTISTTACALVLNLSNESDIKFEVVAYDNIPENCIIVGTYRQMTRDGIKCLESCNFKFPIRINNEIIKRGYYDDYSLESLNIDLQGRVINFGKNCAIVTEYGIIKGAQFESTSLALGDISSSSMINVYVYKNENGTYVYDYTLGADNYLLSNFPNGVYLDSIFYIGTIRFKNADEYGNGDVVIDGCTITNRYLVNSMFNSHEFAFIPSGGNDAEVLPNISTINMEIDFGPDPVFVINGIGYNRNSFESEDDYRHVKLYDTESTSSANYIILDYTNKSALKIYPVVWNENGFYLRRKLFSGFATIIGSVRTTFPEHKYLFSNFKFEYTIDGLKHSSGSESSDTSGIDLTCSPKIEMIAHRGFHQLNIPENSLDAYKYAGLIGYKYCETDFCPTLDNELVLMHDETINRTMRNKADYSALTQNVFVKDKTLQELQNNYVLASDSVKYRKPIPTVKEFLETCRNFNIFPILEIKESGTTKDHVKKAYDLGVKILGVENFGFCSFNYELLDYARTLSDDLMLAYLSWGVGNGDNIMGTQNTITNQSRLSKKTWWYPNYKAVEGYSDMTSVVGWYKESGCKLATWVPPSEDFNTLLKLGIDVIATDTDSPSLYNRKGNVVILNDNSIIGGTITGATINNSEGSLVFSDGGNIQSNFDKDGLLGGCYIHLVAKGEFTIPGVGTINTNGYKEDYIFQPIFKQNSNLIVSFGQNSELYELEYKFVRFL